MSSFLPACLRRVVGIAERHDFLGQAVLWVVGLESEAAWFGSSAWEESGLRAGELCELAMIGQALP